MIWVFSFFLPAIPPCFFLKKKGGGKREREKEQTNDISTDEQTMGSVDCPAGKDHELELSRLKFDDHDSEKVKDPESQSSTRSSYRLNGSLLCCSYGSRLFFDLLIINCVSPPLIALAPPPQALMTGI